MLQLIAVICLVAYVTCHEHFGAQGMLPELPLTSGHNTINGIPYSTRAYWMRRANEALAATGSTCPFAAFGCVVVNHTDSSDVGQLICSGANMNGATGNPTLHEVLTDPEGEYRLTAAEASEVWPTLSLYTNAESCPMCASAIRWAGFREYIYGTSINTLIDKGWGQIRISSVDVFRQSLHLPNAGKLIADVLSNETDPYFSWQFDPESACPDGCSRSDGTCRDV
ncbi:hypothetical protein D0868_08162 [Hortaea werneckii]|uniref:CMP/dCMP-type deaminase domain-containing protein n=1 Tax=Hortaea werneckii TaxID=91943 RepID=A0A3M6YGS9_HORWE|nr:hypothetical protein D0868_08162 [Hortaea werneckii]